MKFTGKERDAETGLDFFGARYFSRPQGRFTSPDKPFADWDLTNPQSWKLYTYVRNSPLIFIDPSGQACVVEKNGKQHDDNSGGQSCADANKASENNIPSVTVTAPQPAVRDLAAEAQAELYRRQYESMLRAREQNRPRPDVPLSPSAQEAITAIANAAPTICGGGLYFYAGKELHAGLVNGFGGTITELDSRDGASKGALFEVGGEGIVGGIGKVVTFNGQGQVADSTLIYGGAGVDAGVAGASAGLVGFTSGAGVYGEGFLFNRGGGVGAYLNVTNNATCNQTRH